MSLRTPILDDRTYAALRDELVARIAVYTPEWTDHEPSDPGITLLELFAFLGENLLYRFNQIPDATRTAFLDLVGVAMRPATAATGLVTVTPSPSVAVPPLLPVRTRLTAGRTAFETRDEVLALPVRALAAVRAAVGVPTDTEVFEHVSRVSVLLGRSVDDVTTYRTTFGAAQPGRPGGDTLDPATGTVDGTLWVALVAATAAAVPAARDALAGVTLSLGVVRAEQVPAMAEIDACPGGAGAAPTPATEWQASTVLPAAGTGPAPDPQWRRLELVADSTGGLTRTGVVGVRFPADVADLGVFAPADPETTGAGDQPPLVDDDDLAATVVCWLRAYRPDGGAVPALDWLGANATRVDQSSTAAAEFLGVGTGQPGQVVRLVHPSVLGTDVGLQVEETGPRWVPWSVVADLDASGPDARHAVLDAAAGTLTFGDGRRGAMPRLGERIRTTGYRFGGGAAGDVAAGAVTGTDLPNVTVTNPVPTRGGDDAESTAAAVARIPGEVRRHDRAVTPDDFRELAAATPGAGIVRAETLPRFDPHHPATELPGAVTVVVWPGVDVAHPGAPRPTRTQLGQVCAYLDDRRLVTTELYVVPPTYRRIAVAVGLAVRPGYGTEAVRRWVEQVLRQYLSPVPPFGPEGGGWPLGRRVHGPELEAAALQVEGVEYLDGLRIAVEADGGGWTELDPPTLTLEVFEVPELVAVTAVAGPAGVPGAGIDAPRPAGPTVPVRRPRELC